MLQPRHMTLIIGQQSRRSRINFRATLIGHQRGMIKGNRCPFSCLSEIIIIREIRQRGGRFDFTHLTKFRILEETSISCRSCFNKNFNKKRLIKYKNKICKKFTCRIGHFFASFSALFSLEH